MPQIHRHTEKFIIIMKTMKTKKMLFWVKEGGRDGGRGEELERKRRRKRKQEGKKTKHNAKSIIGSVVLAEGEGDKDDAVARGGDGLPAAQSVLLADAERGARPTRRTRAR